MGCAHRSSFATKASFKPELSLLASRAWVTLSEVGATTVLSGFLDCAPGAGDRRRRATFHVVRLSWLRFQLRTERRTHLGRC